MNPFSIYDDPRVEFSSIIDKPKRCNDTIENNRQTDNAQILPVASTHFFFKITARKIEK